MTSTAFARRADAQDGERSGETRLTRLLFAGCIAQFALLASLSIYEVTHAALTWDFAVYYQAFWLIAHGDLQPFSSMGRIPFAQVHANFLMWPLALLGTLSAQPLTLKLVQDAATSSASLIALLWSGEILAERVANAGHRRLILTGVLLTLVLNPWIYEANAYDFHFFSITALALLGLSRALYGGRTGEAVLWALFGISAGDVTTTQISACAFGLALFVRRARPAGFAIAAAGAAWFAFVAHFGLVKGDILAVNYGYLAKRAQEVTPLDVLLGLLAQPQVVAGKFAAHWDMLYANLAPGGFVGALSPLTIFPSALTLFENVMSSTPANFYIGPGAQNCPVYLLMVPGLAWSLAWAYQRLGSRLALALMLLAAANAAGWFCVIYPGAMERWSRVDDDDVARIAQVARLAGNGGEVIASQRFVGALAGRREVYGLLPGETVPLAPRTFVAVLSIEGVPQSYAALATVAALPNAHVLRASNEFWTFEIDGASPAKLTFPKTATILPAYVLATDFGRRDFVSRTLTTDRAAHDGYLVRGAYWRSRAGDYVARATLASSAPVALEVWNLTQNRLVASRQFARGGRLALPFSLRGDAARRPIRDWPYHHTSALTVPDDMLDLRVRVAPGARASVRDVSLFEARPKK